MSRTESPELAALLEHMPYVVQSRDPHAHDERREWYTRRDLGDDRDGNIRGKTKARERISTLQAKHPNLRWRFLQRNEADAYDEGVAAGKRLTESTSERRPRMYMPEHL